MQNKESSGTSSKKDRLEFYVGSGDMKAHV